MPKVPKNFNKNQHNAPRKKKLWAIIVGINQYDDFEQLKFCANDAVAFANTLQKVSSQELPDTEAIFNETQIIVHAHHTDRYSWSEIIPPQQDKILASLGVLNEVQPQDTILFYFSGHGHYDEHLNDTILCLEKTSKDNLAGTGLLITTVLAKIINSPAKQQLILLDACHSGGVASQLIDAILQITKNKPSLNLYCITACDRHQQSFETPELEHGIFTYHLLEGLKGEGFPSLVKIDDLYSFVASKTQNYIDRTNEVWNLIYRYKPYPNFKPQRLVTGEGEFILGVSSNQTQDNRARGALVLDGFCPSQNIIDISQSLATQGGFAYQPYPNKSESVADSISALLTSSATTTALLYLQGKFETNDNGAWFVFADGIRVSRDWLAQQLTDTTVHQQIIIFDCCQTSNIKTHVEALKQFDKSQCIVAISRSDNWFVHKFLEIVKGNTQNGLTATQLIRQLEIIYHQQGFIDYQLRDFYRSEKGILNVLLNRKEHLSEIIIDRNYCPYKSLEAFTFEDKDFFFGRQNLIQETINQLKEKNFLLVVGASGSGKSSLVQAGVVPFLLEKGLSDSENSCQVWTLRPGEYPVRELAHIFNKQNYLPELEQLCLAVEENQLAPEYLEGILYLGVESLVSWLSQQPHDLGILVIDQFEELFTQANDIERKLFLQLIFGAVQSQDSRLKVIATLRSDFLTSCLEIPQLAEKVQQDSLFIPSLLTEEEYRQIITAPAFRVGLGVEPELVNVLVEEVLNEKGALPLLQVTLEQLWQNRVGGKLSLAVYRQKIGGIKQVLRDKANSLYQELTTSQQKCAQWIFTQLVSLGEGKEDTKRRRNLSELIVPKYPSDLIKSTLDKLRDSRLIVMSNLDRDLIEENLLKVSTSSQINPNKADIQSLAVAKGLEPSPQADTKISEPVPLSLNAEITIEIAHEILIRNWRQLRWWLDTNREQIRSRARIEERAKDNDDLLQGIALAQVEKFYINYGDELTEQAQEFIRRSIEQRDKQVRLAKLRRKQVIGSLTAGIVAISLVAAAALWQLRMATLNEINAQNNSAEALSASNRELDGLITGLKAGNKIQEKSWLGIDDKTRIGVMANLQNIFAKIKEVNRLESHTNIKSL